MQLITRKLDFDAAHRVMNECFQCYMSHGHRYTVHLTFSYEEQEAIGYAIDFKEIKRVYVQWILDNFDHGAIYNPKDVDFIAPCRKHRLRLWLMSLNGCGEYCNPSVENIAKEIFLAMEVLTESYPLLKIHSVLLYETANCYTTCIASSIKEEERLAWGQTNYEKVSAFSASKGIQEYDDRKLKGTKNV